VALVSVLPALAGVARVERKSTSAGLYRADTGDPIAGSDGLHVYLLVQDGTDGERFLKVLHARAWLSGFGWIVVGTGGQLLERSIVDRVVGSPERLIFEGPPVLDPPLAQHQEMRRPVAVDGDPLDTLAACPPLTLLEEARLRELRAREASRLALEVTRERNAFIARQSSELVRRTGMSLSRARRTIERQCDGILLPDVVLPFDDAELAGKTVADVLAEPTAFAGATLSDPVEGPEYGRCKARIMLRADGTVWVNSFAHGRSVYELRLDYPASRAALERVAKDEVAETLVRLVLGGDLAEDEVEQLRNLAHQKSGINKRMLDKKLKTAREAAAALRAKQEADRRLAARQDPRPLVPAPAKDAEWLPMMTTLNGVLGSSCAGEPPMRDFAGYVAEVRSRPFRGLHVLTALGSNCEDTDETRLPPPEHPLLCRLSEVELAELIERHIEFADETGRSVHLPEPFVKHYLCRFDEKLPLVTGVCTLPLVLPGGELLTGPGLVRHLNTVFRVPAELCALLPEAKDCTRAAVAQALRFLTHNWLCDVAVDFAGRCVLVADALTIIERQILPMRPGFFIGAGKRGGGKTTTLNMLSYAVLGQPAAAAAWSTNEEERRKALFSYLLDGIAMLVWDNIASGTTVSCPSIEKSLTAELYSDRLLGLSESRLVPAYTIQHFTGNNIAPGGDMASRSLRIMIEVTRPDPENRTFRHPDPSGWTRANRGEILRAFYTILRGNPRRTGKAEGTPQTRFKEWHDLVGSAVEHAAEVMLEEIKGFVADPLPDCPVKLISFKEMFLEGEASDDETAGLAGLLLALRKQYPNKFRAREVASYLEPEGYPPTDDAREMMGLLVRASGNKPLRPVSASTVSARLKKLIKAPVWAGEETLMLKCEGDARTGDFFSVETMVREQPQ
jgi:hypothetical protein